MLGDSVGLALLMVLDTLTPAERLAFVLHDMFAQSFDEITPIADRTPGVVTAPDGQTFSVMAFTVAGGRIVRIDILADPVRLQRLGISPRDA